MVLIRLVFKDEASIIFTNKYIDRIKGKSLKEAIKIINNSEELDMYAFLVRIDDLNDIANGRAGHGVEVPKDLEPSIVKIVNTATPKGNFVEFTWRNPPFDHNYVKRAFVKLICIEGQEYVIGAGYPLNAQIIS